MKSTKRAPAGRWKPGQSGNPAGRPRGSGDVSQLREAIRHKVPTIIDKLTELAVSGDVGAARLLLERVIPPLKAAEQAVPLSLPSGSLTDQGRTVLAAVAAGDLAPSQGAGLLASLGTLGKLIEVDELERRVAALEGTRGN
jgi:hypothetical protein